MATSGSSIQETECGLSIQSGRLSQVGRMPGRSVNVDVDTSRSDPIDWSMFEARPRTPSWCRRAEAAWRARNKVNSMLRQKQGKGEAGCTGLQGMQLTRIRSSRAQLSTSGSAEPRRREEKRDISAASPRASAGVELQPGASRRIKPRSEPTSGRAGRSRAKPNSLQESDDTARSASLSLTNRRRIESANQRVGRGCKPSLELPVTRTPTWSCSAVASWHRSVSVTRYGSLSASSRFRHACREGRQRAEKWEHHAPCTLRHVRMFFNRSHAPGANFIFVLFSARGLDPRFPSSAHSRSTPRPTAQSCCPPTLPHEIIDSPRPSSVTQSTRQEIQSQSPFCSACDPVQAPRKHAKNRHGHASSCARSPYKDAKLSSPSRKYAPPLELST
ncbi:hypothetical protein L1887_58284 [Cichorium endivia]|nr:hypothetical protein L1887_58284 [Cichorium endivia]